MQSAHFLLSGLAAGIAAAQISLFLRALPLLFRQKTAGHPLALLVLLGTFGLWQLHTHLFGTAGLGALLQRSAAPGLPLALFALSALAGFLLVPLAARWLGRGGEEWAEEGRPRA